MTIGRYDNMDWETLREEYVAGGTSLSALARKHGVSDSTLRRHARKGGWKEQAGQAASVGSAEPVKAEAPVIAERVRRRLLLKLERAADEFPCDATEIKTQDDSTVKLLKLRDLTAAYKELVGDMPRDGTGKEESRVIIDV